MYCPDSPKVNNKVFKYYLGKVYLLQGNKLNEKGTDKENKY